MTQLLQSPSDQYELLKHNEAYQQFIFDDCFRDLSVFSKFFLPKHYPMPWGTGGPDHQPHGPLFNAVMNGGNYQVIAAPRGVAKTSIAGISYILHQIVYQQRKYIVYITSEEKLALLHGLNITDELNSNERIINTFGYLINPDRYTQRFWRTKSGISLLPRGSGQRIRGTKVNAQRPDLIVIDDIEDDEGVRSETQREYLLEWFYGTVLESMAPEENARCLVLGSILHFDSLIANLVKSSTWDSVDIRVCNDDLISYWESNPKKSTEALKRGLARAKESGKEDVFYQENANITISKDNRRFQRSWFQYYNAPTGESGKPLISEYRLSHDPEMETIILADPARAHQAKKAETAVVGITINKSQPLGQGNQQVPSAVYVRDIVHGYMPPDLVYQEMLSMAQRLNASILAPEVTGLEDYIMSPLRQMLVTARSICNIIPITANRSKELRISSLIPLFRAGLVWLNSTNSTPLEQQLLFFPRAKLIDIADCLAHVNTLLERGSIVLGQNFEDFDDFEEQPLGFDEPELVHMRYSRARDDRGRWRLV